MLKLTVTGGLGHIGSALIRRIPAELTGQIDIIDNLCTQRYAAMFQLQERPSCRLIEQDVRTADLDKHFRKTDAVVHLAAIAGPRDSHDSPEEAESVNYEGTRSVAEACLRRGCRLIFVSTTSVYGANADALTEECLPEYLNPQSPYAESKLRAEKLLLRMEAEHGLKCVILRFGSVFGTSPGMRFDTAVNRFVWQACTGRPLGVWRTALAQKRPYLEMEDAVQALIFTLTRDLCGVYNVVTLNDTVEGIIGAISQFVPDLTVEYVDSPVMNSFSYSVSADRLKARGFEFRGELRRGVGNTVALLAAARRNGAA